MTPDLFRLPVTISLLRVVYSSQKQLKYKAIESFWNDYKIELPMFNNNFLRSKINNFNPKKEFSKSLLIESCQIAICSYKCFSGGSESSWDKDKMQSSLAAPGPQHGLAHTSLANQPSFGGAPALNPLQQNHLLTNSMYAVLSKIGVLRKIPHKTHWITWAIGIMYFSSIALIV